MLRRIFWSPFPVFAVNSVWLSGVCEHNLYSPGFFYAICRCQSLYAPVIYMSKHSFFKKKSLKVTLRNHNLRDGTFIWHFHFKFDEHDRFWTRNVSCPKLRNVKVTNEFHWQLDYNPRVVKLFGM